MTASSADLAPDSSGQLPFLSGRPPRSLKSPQEVLKCRNLQVNDYVTGAGQLTRGKQGLFKQRSPIAWSKALQLGAGEPGSGPLQWFPVELQLLKGLRKGGELGLLYLVP